jgi:hypothetical protein
MREFEDGAGGRWMARVAEREGVDYKGRFHLVFDRGESEEAVELVDVRWNSARTADRTLRTMSEVELRRRLHSARGRGASKS